MKLQYKTIVAIIYTIILFLDRLDLTIVNVTFFAIAKYFDIDVIQTESISVAFLVSLAIFIPISNWLSSRFGAKNIYIFSIFCFGISSSCIIFAENLNQIVVLRFIQGIGGGILIPVGMTMLYRLYDKSEYASITSFTFLPALLAPAFAPLIGGVILDHFGWKSVFLVSGPICIILASICIIFLKKDDYRDSKSLDILGFISIAIFLTTSFYSLSLIRRNHFGMNFLVSIIVIITTFVIFIKAERKVRFPLIDLKLFNSKLFVKASLMQLGFQICHFGSIFLIGLYLQVGIGMTATKTGLIMGMQAIGAICVSRYSVKLYNKYGYKSPITFGLVGIAIATPMIMFVNSTEKIWLGLIILFIRGLFSGLCGTPIQTLSLIDFDQDKMGEVNMVFNVFRQISISFGVALFSILISVGVRFFDNNTKLNYLFGFIIVPIICMLTIRLAKK